MRVVSGRVKRCSCVGPKQEGERIGGGGVGVWASPLLGREHVQGNGVRMLTCTCPQPGCGKQEAPVNEDKARCQPASSPLLAACEGPAHFSRADGRLARVRKFKHWRHISRSGSWNCAPDHDGSLPTHIHRLGTAPSSRSAHPCARRANGFRNLTRSRLIRRKTGRLEERQDAHEREREHWGGRDACHNDTGANVCGEEEDGG